MTNSGQEDFSSKTIKLSYDHELITTCYHEAGHTISGLFNFMTIPSVYIEIPRNRKIKTKINSNLGITLYEAAISYDDVKDEELYQKLVMSDIYINYAGLAAEKLFYKEICGTDQLPMALKHGSYLDRDNVSDIIKKYNLAPPGRKRHLFKKKALNDCMRTLSVMWEDVRLVAHALYKSRKLYHADLQEILIKKSPNRNFWKKQFRAIELLQIEIIQLDEKKLKAIMTR